MVNAFAQPLVFISHRLLVLKASPARLKTPMLMSKLPDERTRTVGLWPFNLGEEERVLLWKASNTLIHCKQANSHLLKADDFVYGSTFLSSIGSPCLSIKGCYSPVQLLLPALSQPTLGKITTSLCCQRHWICERTLSRLTDQTSIYLADKHP